MVDDRDELHTFCHNEYLRYRRHDSPVEFSPSIVVGLNCFFIKRGVTCKHGKVQPRGCRRVSIAPVLPLIMDGWMKFALFFFYGAALVSGEESRMGGRGAPASPPPPVPLLPLALPPGADSDVFTTSPTPVTSTVSTAAKTRMTAPTRYNACLRILLKTVVMPCCP